MAGGNGWPLVGRDDDRSPILDITRPDDPSALTPREHETAALAAKGFSSRDIAGKLGVSVRTVDNHLHRAYSKLGVASRDELADALSRGE